MSDQRQFMEMLRSTSARLFAIRKSIADSGNIETMREIDTLLSVAQSETDRELVGATLRRSDLPGT